ncbi:MAG TPA: YbhN family protein [Acidimicrobiales bacterium]|nr:YbhN family protein [Acidimicrobiales bacterium]
MSTGEGTPATAVARGPDAPAGADEADGPPPTGWRDPRVRRALSGLLSLVIVGGIFWFVLGQFSDLSSVWRSIRSLSGAEVALIVAVSLFNLATYVPVMVLATPGLKARQSFVLTETTTAVSNALPAGGAIGVGLTYTMLGSWGFSKSRSTLSVLVTGIWNNFVKLGTPIVALAILVLQGQPGGGRLVAALVGLVGLVTAVVVFALILRSDDFARRAGLTMQGVATRMMAPFHKGPATGWDNAVAKFRSRVLGLVRHRWLALTAVTLLSHLALYAVLLTCLRCVGVPDSEVSWAEALVSFSFARLVTAIPLTPGGVGVVELALIGSLTGFGGDRPEVVAAVLIFRLFTYVLPILLGAFTYLFWRQNRSWHDSAPPMPASLAPVAIDDAPPATPAPAAG